MLRSSGPSSEPACRRTRPASSSSRRASCAPAEIRALAGQAGIAPGVSVLDLCCGVAGPGRFITPELGCTYLGVDFSSSAIDIARERARDLPCRFEVSRIPPIPPGPFDVVLLLETMLAFPEKETLLRRDIPGAHDRRAVRLHHGGGPAAHGGRARDDARRRHGLADPAGGDAQLAWSGSGWSFAGRMTAVGPTVPWRIR